jgi:hypothetical protein
MELIKGRKTKKKLRSQFLNIYCIKCSLHGSGKVVGNLLIKVTEVCEGKIEVDMNLEVGPGIGTYAQHIYGNQFDFDLFNVPVSLFTIGVLTVGPYISIGTRATFEVNAAGTLIAKAFSSSQKPSSPTTSRRSFASKSALTSNLFLNSRSTASLASRLPLVYLLLSRSV